jgi:hypothetical protein
MAIPEISLPTVKPDRTMQIHLFEPNVLARLRRKENLAPL